MDAGVGLSENISVKNDGMLYKFGVKGDYDLSKGLHDIYGVFEASGFSWGKLWMRNNFSQNIFGLGKTFKLDKNDFSCEAMYDYNEKSKPGLIGFPAFFRLGHQRQLNSDMLQKNQVNLGSQWWLSSQTEMTADKNTKVSILATMNLMSWFKLGKPTAKFGANIEYTL